MEKMAVYFYKDQAVRIGIKDEQIVVERLVKRVGITKVWVPYYRIDPLKLEER